MTECFKQLQAKRVYFPPPQSLFAGVFLEFIQDLIVFSYEMPPKCWNAFFLRLISYKVIQSPSSFINSAVIVSSASDKRGRIPDYNTNALKGLVYESDV